MAEPLRDAAANGFTLNCHRLTNISLFRHGDDVSEPISRCVNFKRKEEFDELYTKPMMQSGKRMNARERRKLMRSIKPPDFLLDHNGKILAESSGKNEFLLYHSLCLSLTGNVCLFRSSKHSIIRSDSVRLNRNYLTTHFLRICMPFIRGKFRLIFWKMRLVSYWCLFER